MRVLIFPPSDSSRIDPINQLATALSRDGVGHTIVGAASAADDQLIELYDITTRPAVAVVQDDGQLAQRWLGQVPPASEVAYWARL